MSARPPLHGGRRPRVLFVAYGFPPRRTAGTVRTWNVAKYLSRRGWDVTVLTPDPSLWRHVERAEATEISLATEGIRRLSTGHRWRALASEVLDYPDHGVRWLLGGLSRRVARRLGVERAAGWTGAAVDAGAPLRAGDVDVVLASGPPFSAFRVARRLADRLGCPYTLDYRDLWSRNLHDPSPRAASEEAALVARCAAVTIVSPAWGRVMHEQFDLGPKMHVVSNGYDAEELSTVTPYDFGHFAIVYTGVFYPPRRTVSPLLAALRGLHRIASGEWRFHYYGTDQAHVRSEAERFGVTDRVVVHGKVPREEALSAVKGAGVAVVITSVAEGVTTEDKGMVTGKIFEAIGLGAPTLLIAPPGSDAGTVAETSGLGRHFSAGDVDGIVSFLSDLVEGHAPPPKDPAAFAWENLIGGLDQVLRDVVGAAR